jgi:hypothetical protein
MRAIIVLPLAMLLAATSTAKDVTIKVTPEMETFSDAPVFKIMVTNESGDYVSVLGPSIDLPPELYPDQPTFSPDRQFDLPDGAFREIQVPGPPMSRREILRNAFLRPKSYDAPVRVRYKQSDNSVRNTAQQPATLAPLAPWWAVTLGAMVGVVAVLSFRYLSGRVQKRAASAAKSQPEAPSPATPPPVQVGGGAAAAPPIAAPVPPAAAESQPEPTSWWGLLLLGWLVVIMAVLIFRFTSTQFPDLPITVNVKDVYGGFALGLVFQPLVHFFSQTLA